MLTIIGAVASVITLLLTIKYLLRPTWLDAFRMARKLLDETKQKWEPDVVIGIGRSGGIWGGWLAGNLGAKPFLGVDVHYIQPPKGKGREVHFPGAEQVLSALEEFKKLGNNVLLVEGAASTGQTFRCFLERLLDQLGSWEIKKAVLYKNPAAAIDIEFVGRRLERWPERFPWHDRRGKWGRFLRNGTNNEPWFLVYRLPVRIILDPKVREC